jgi:hypothetical protein
MTNVSIILFLLIEHDTLLSLEVRIALQMDWVVDLSIMERLELIT